MKKNIKRVFTLSLSLLIVAFCSSGQNIVPKKGDKNSKWGYVDSSTDKWIVKPKFDKAGALEKQPNGKMRGQVSTNGKTGFIDESGNILGAGVVFEDMSPLEGDAMIVTVNGKKGIANYDGVYLIKPELTKIEPLANEGYFITKKDKVGFIKPDGTLIFDVIYNKINPSGDNYFIIDKGGKAGIALRDGTIKLVPANYTNVEPFDEYWLVFKNDKKGLYDLNKNSLLIEPNYSEILPPFTIKGHRYFAVKKKDKWGVNDTFGNPVIEAKNKKVVPMPEVEAIYTYSGSKGGLYFMPSKEFMPVTSVNVEKIGPFNQTEIKTYKGTFYSTSDKDGNTIVYGESIKPFDKYYLIKTDPKSTVYDIYTSDGALLCKKLSYPRIRNKWLIADDVALSPQGDKYICRIIQDLMFIRKSDNEPWSCVDIPANLDLSFEDISISQDGEYINVKSNGLWGLLSKDGYIIKPISDTPVENYKNDIYKYYRSGKKGLASNKNGEFLPASYDEIRVVDYHENHIVLAEGEYWGVYDLQQNKWIIPLSNKFVGVSSLEDGYVGHYKNGKLQLFDSNGKRINSAPKLTLKNFGFTIFGDIEYTINYQNCPAEYYTVQIALFKGNRKENVIYSQSRVASALSGSWSGTKNSNIYFVNDGDYTAKILVYDPNGKLVMQGNKSLPLTVGRKKRHRR